MAWRSVKDILFFANASRFSRLLDATHARPRLQWDRSRLGRRGIVGQDGPVASSATSSAFFGIEMTISTPPDIELQLSAAVTILQQHLGSSLLALHLFGSAVDGGLQHLSDIDLLATVAKPLPDARRLSLMKDLLDVSAWPPTPSLRPLEVTVVARDAVVPWRHAPVRELQFGEWLREDLENERLEPAMPDADLAILLTKARRRSVCIHGIPAAQLFDPVPPVELARALLHAVSSWNEESDWSGEERNVVLTLARIWYTLCTGEIASKDAAAAWARPRLPREHQPVMSAARAAYLGQAADDLGERSSEVAAFIEYVKARIAMVAPADGSPRFG